MIYIGRKVDIVHFLDSSYYQIRESIITLSSINGHGIHANISQLKTTTTHPDRRINFNRRPEHHESCYFPPISSCLGFGFLILSQCL